MGAAVSAMKPAAIPPAHRTRPASGPTDAEALGNDNGSTIEIDVEDTPEPKAIAIGRQHTIRDIGTEPEAASRANARQAVARRELPVGDTRRDLVARRAKCCATKNRGE